MTEFLILSFHVWWVGAVSWLSLCAFITACYYADYCRAGGWNDLRDARKWLLRGLWAPVWPLTLTAALIGAVREILQDGKRRP